MLDCTIAVDRPAEEIRRVGGIQAASGPASRCETRGTRRDDDGEQEEQRSHPRHHVRYEIDSCCELTCQEQAIVRQSVIWKA